MKSTRNYKLNIITVIWGQKYCDVFLKHTLPSLNSKKNIPAIKDIRYTLYTNKEDFDYIQSNFPEIKFGLIKWGQDVHSANRHAFDLAHKNGEVLRIQPSDCIVSDGSLSFAFKKIKEGIKHVVIPIGALRVNRNEFPEKYSNDFSILRNLFIEHMHQETRRHKVDAHFFFDKPVMKIEQFSNCVLVNSYFYEPFMFDCLENPLTYTNIEMDIVKDEKSFYAAKDSSEIFEISLTPNDDIEHGRNSFIEANLKNYANSIGIGSINQKIYEMGYRII